MAFAGAGGGLFRPGTLPPLMVSVQAMLDRGARAGQGLGEADRSQFRNYQEQASRAYAASGTRFDVRVLEGAYLRRHGYAGQV